MGRTVRFYFTEDGKCPVKEFLDSLSGKTARKIVWVLKLVEEMDIVPSSYFKKLEGSKDLWECRVQQGSNAYRILGFFAGHATLVLTHGFIKKSQKTPAREIEKAENYRSDFLRRRKDRERS